MRFMPPIIIALTVAALGVAPAAAQELGDKLTLTGCLAQDTVEMEPGFVLENVASDEVDAGSVPLVPTGELDMSPHVGHTVEVSGVVAAQPAEGQAQQGEEPAPAAGEWILRVMELSHIAATCPEGAMR